MTSQFKVGDMAVLINCGCGNDFRTVELLEFIGIPDAYAWRNGLIKNTRSQPIWIVRSLGEPLTLSRSARQYFGVASMQVAPMYERRLMPLRGEPAPKEQRVAELTS